MKYGRSDIDYATFYGTWSKRMALTATRQELEKLQSIYEKKAKKDSAAHLRAIQSTSSMISSSQRRAQSRNSLFASAEKRLAISAALEIYELFPEKTKEST